MPVEIVTVPCRADNYAYLVRDEGTGQVALVDAPEAAPIVAALEERGWELDQIWITLPAPKNSRPLKNACVIRWKIAATYAPTPAAANM